MIDVNAIIMAQKNINLTMYNLIKSKMKKLEEVKEYFKNAKEVICLYNGLVVDITKNKISEIRLLDNDYWIDIANHDGINVKLYDGKTNTYAEIISYKDEPKDGGSCINDFKTPKHYDNSKGSIYQFCENQKLNSYEFDIIKRVVRCRKKGDFKQDLEKTKALIDLYLKENENNGNA